MANFDPDIFNDGNTSGSFDEEIFNVKSKPSIATKPAPKKEPQAEEFQGGSVDLRRIVDLTGNAANKAISGAVDMFGNAPQNIVNLAKMAYGTGATALGRPDLAPEIKAGPDYARRLMEGAQLIRQSAEPQTAGERVYDRTIQGGVGMMLNPARSVAQTGAMAALGGMSGLSAGATKEVTGSDALANSVAVLAPIGFASAANRAAINAAEQAAAQRMNAPRDNALTAGLAEGYAVPPSMVRPTLTTRLLEGVGGKIATAQEMTVNNAAITDKLLRRSIGMDPTEALTPAAVSAIRKQAYSEGYAPIEGAGQISVGKTYREALDKITEKYAGAERSFPGATRNDVAEMVDKLRPPGRSFDAGDGLKMSAILRDEASDAFRAGDKGLGQAKRAASKAIEDQIELGLSAMGQNGAGALEKFRAARALMAKTHSVEDAIVAGTGTGKAASLGSELQAGKPLTGDLLTIAQMQKNFPQAMRTEQSVGSPGVNNLTVVAGGTLGSLLGGGLGGAMGGGAPGMSLGAAIGAVAPYAAQNAARAIQRSGPYQRGLLPDYSPSVMDGLLLAAPQDARLGGLLGMMR